MKDERLLVLTAGIVSAHLLSNPMPAERLPELVRTVHAALAGLLDPVEPPPPVGAVEPAESLADPGHILSMLDGRPYRSLKRHLARHGHTPESYRAAFRLPADYPMTAPAYSESRRALAARTGLGRHRRPRGDATS